MSDEDTKSVAMDFAGIARPTCSSCPYFDAGKIPASEVFPGRCRHKSPNSGRADGGAQWWSVTRDDWCGDHPMLQAMLSKAQVHAALSPLMDGVHDLVGKLTGGGE